MELIKVIDGLYYFKLILPPHGFGDLNCFVIPDRHGGRNLLIDTGSHKRHYRVAFFDALRELNFTPENTDIFISHNHSDHTGNVNELSDLGYRILIGRIAYEKERLSYLADSEMLRKEGVEEVPEGVEFTGKIMTCDIQNANVVLLEEGDVLHYGGFTLRCLLTPGHSMGHLCLYEEGTKTMFLGDHVLYDVAPAITRNPYSKDALQDYMDSLRNIASYDVERTLATHGAYDGNLQQRLRELMGYHISMLAAMERFVTENPGGTGKIYAEKMNVLRFGKLLTETSSGETYFALYEGFAWLDHLVNTGRIIRKEADGVYLYYPQ